MANHSDVIDKMNKFDKCLQTMSKELKELRNIYTAQREQFLKGDYEFEINQQMCQYNRGYGCVDAIITIISKETFDYFQGKLYWFFDNVTNKHAWPIKKNEYIDDGTITSNERPQTPEGYTKVFKTIFPNRDFYIKDLVKKEHSPLYSYNPNGGCRTIPTYSFKVKVFMPVTPILINLMD